MSFVSYAQNFEDVLLHRVFGGQETGFYVDVGAYHPVMGSVTKAFYDKGWAGINIEPGSVFSELAAARPRDVNLRMVVFDHAGEIAFFEDDADRGMSRVVMDAGGGSAQDASGIRTLPCDTLQAIVDTHSSGRPVDFIKIDAEGSESAIVHATDWRRLRPRVLLLEATRPWSSMLANQEWEPALIQQGYVRAYFDGINCFYIPEEEAPVLLRHFQVPVNVLDRAERYENEAAHAGLRASQAEVACLTAERDRLSTALGAVSAEVKRLSAELQAGQAEVARLTAELETLRAAVDAKAAEVARMTAERDALRVTLDEERAAAVRAAEAARTQPTPVASEAPPRRIHNVPVRRAVRAAYRIVRPIVRPVAWRLRTFMTGDLAAQLLRLEQRVGVPAAGPVQRRAVSAPGTIQPSEIRDDVAAAEMRRLAVEMERTLLTLALERAPEPWCAAQPDAAPELSQVALLLPHGRRMEVACRPGDLSVAASLAASDGDWEPHVRRYLESTVRPDWACLDIGANLGAHTLSLAVLAHEGRVVSFEADAANFALLSRNAAALEQPRAAIEPVHLALWDRAGTLVFGGADELAGCSFVADDLDAETIEGQLRTVVDATAIDGIKLHIRSGRVPALPLDAWADAKALPRLDLIKLDVEGAEARVIRGADATLRRCRPLLLVEYNPACAAAYFGQPPEALYEELVTRFAAIHVLEQDATLTLVPDWPTLQTRLLGGKGWEDLVCMPNPPVAH